MRDEDGKGDRESVLARCHLLCSTSSSFAATNNLPSIRSQWCCASSSCEEEADEPSNSVGPVHLDILAASPGVAPTLPLGPSKSTQQRDSVLSTRRATRKKNKVMQQKQQQQHSPVPASAPAAAAAAAPSHTSTLLPRQPSASSLSARRRIQIRPLPRPPATSTISFTLKSIDHNNANLHTTALASGPADSFGQAAEKSGNNKNVSLTLPKPPRRSSSLSVRSTSTRRGSNNNNTSTHSPTNSITSAPSPTSPSARSLATGTVENGRRRSSASTTAAAPPPPVAGRRNSTVQARSILKDHRSAPHPPAATTAATTTTTTMTDMAPPLIPLMAALLNESKAGSHPTAAVNGDSSSKGLAQGSKRTSPKPIDNAPVDLREALSYCTDPTMSWSLQFWVTIADPLTNDVFFACPATGQCSWEPPVGAVPRSPDGEWWELADASRDNQSYYYNTLTGVTQWQRPEGDAFVIPLGLIQRNALPSPRTSSSSDSPEKLSPSQHGTDSQTSGSVRFAANSTSAAALRRSSHDMLPPQAGSATASSSGPLTPIADMSPMSEQPPSDDRQSWWDRRRARSRLLSSPSKSNLKGRSPDASPDLTNGHSNGNGNGSVNGHGGLVASPDTSPLLGGDGSSLPSHMSPSAVNIILQPSSPTAATYQLENFSTDNFADRYFATKRSGVLRQRMSLERIMEWQRGAITAPLLVLSKTSVQDAVTTFKVIQHVMGDRERPVDGVSLPASLPNPSMLSLRSTRDDGRDEKTIILEEIRWMIQLGVGRIEMRDELFCQLIKQLTRNPETDATVLGFQLFCVFVHAFGPSKSFEPFVRSFLIGNVERPAYGIGVMSKFCLTRLDTWMQKGGRGRVLTIAEIEHASDAAFYPSVFRQTLETIMQRQEGAYPELRIPIILPFLADGILALGGTESEGIFRVPGDQDIITHLKARIDHGQYQLSGINDPHVVASLFKLWLRELEEPVVPTNLYDAALEAAKSPDHTILFLKKLPDHNRRVLLFVVSFLQLFLDAEVVEVTKMTSRNLALVLAPNVLRTPDDSLSTVFANSGFECQFVLNLLEHLDPPSVDPEFVPMHGVSGRASFESSIDETHE